MEGHALKEKIQTLAYDLGIDKIGFASAEPFLALEGQLRQRKAAGYTTGFEHPVIEDRVYLDRIFPDPRSLIAICLAYPSKLEDPPDNPADNRRGQFARASWGVDYHDLVREKMDLLSEGIKALAPQAEIKAMVDTGELSDVHVAARAGIGFIGRNGLLITKEFGSYVYLGELITNLGLPADPPVDYDCGDCYRCVRACPTGALLGNGEMNGQICLSYQTQVKGYVAEGYRRKMTSVIYGCDICQLACPYNQGKHFNHHPKMQPDQDLARPPLKPMLKLSNREFKETFGHLAGAWRGKKPLQRNAIIALANYRDQTALPDLLDLMENDPRPMIRGTAAWAISVIQRFYNPVLIECVKDQAQLETDPETQAEFEAALRRLETKRKDP